MNYIPNLAANPLPGQPFQSIRSGQH